MASLTDVADRTKKYTAIAVIILIASLVLKLVVSTIGFITYLISLSAPLVATNGFGTLPALQINALPYQTNAQTQYILNTPNGGFNAEPPVADVYGFVNQSGLSLLSLDSATRTAANMGFVGVYQKVSDGIYVWKNSSKQLIFNIQTNQYRIVNTNINGHIGIDTTAQNGTLSLTQSGASTAAGTMLQTLGISNDYNIANPSVIFLNYQNNVGLVQPDDTTANAIKVIFYRSYKYLKVNSVKSFSNSVLPLLSDNPLAGNISFTLDADSATLTSSLLEMSYNDWAIDGSSFSTYALKNPQQAWQDVQNGSADLVYLVKDGTSPFAAYQTLQVAKFQAEDISLAYFDGIKQQQYLQPIYVIKGTAILNDGSSAQFYFYDPAVI